MVATNSQTHPKGAKQPSHLKTARLSLEHGLAHAANLLRETFFALRFCINFFRNFFIQKNIYIGLNPLYNRPNRLEKS